MIGIWDEGGVSNQRPGLTGRIHFGIGESFLGEEAHTISVASILGIARQGSGPQGIAYQSHLKIYTDTHDFPEMIQEAANGMTFSNHSYSPGAGWEFDQFGNAEWWGPATAGPTDEDPEFGSYTQNSRTIDSIIYTARSYLPTFLPSYLPTFLPSYLPVFTASNDANDGSPAGLGDPTFTYSLVTFAPDPNDPTVLVKTITTVKQPLTHPTQGTPTLILPRLPLKKFMKSWKWTTTSATESDWAWTPSNRQARQKTISPLERPTLTKQASTLPLTTSA